MGQTPSAITLVAVDLHTPRAWERNIDFVAYAQDRQRRDETLYSILSPDLGTLYLRTEHYELALKIWQDRDRILHEAGLDAQDVTVHFPRPDCAGGPRHVPNQFVDENKNYRCSLCNENLGQVWEDRTCKHWSKTVLDEELNVHCSTCNHVLGKLKRRNDNPTFQRVKE